MATRRRHVKECSDDLAAASEQVQDLCCGLRNVNPLACRYRHDHPPATSLASITNSWQHGAAQRVPCLSMEGSRCAKGLVYSLSLNRCVDACSCTWQSRLTVLDAALVVVQPGASIAARCTLKFPGIDSILCLRGLEVEASRPGHDSRFEHSTKSIVRGVWLPAASAPERCVHRVKPVIPYFGH